MLREKCKWGKFTTRFSLPLNMDVSINRRTFNFLNSKSDPELHFPASDSFAKTPKVNIGTKKHQKLTSEQK